MDEAITYLIPPYLEYAVQTAILEVEDLSALMQAIAALGTQFITLPGEVKGWHKN